MSATRPDGSRGGIREAELREVLDTLCEKGPRRCRHVLVTGPPGIGKTALLREAEKRIAADETLRAKLTILRAPGAGTEGGTLARAVTGAFEDLIRKLEQAGRREAEAARRVLEDALENRSADVRGKRCIEAMQEVAAGTGRRIVVIVEGIDEIAEGGCRRTESAMLMADVLRRNPEVAIAATATRTKRRPYYYAAPFGALMEEVRVSPLDAAGCAALWRNLTGAGEDGAAAVTAAGAGRLLEILTGGYPALLKACARGRTGAPRAEDVLRDCAEAADPGMRTLLREADTDNGRMAACIVAGSRTGMTTREVRAEYGRRESANPAHLALMPETLAQLARDGVLENVHGGTGKDAVWRAAGTPPVLGTWYRLTAEPCGAAGVRDLARWADAWYGTGPPEEGGAGALTTADVLDAAVERGAAAALEMIAGAGAETRMEPVVEGLAQKTGDGGRAVREVEMMAGDVAARLKQMRKQRKKR